MFGNSWRLGADCGVEVRINTSWVIIALLVTYSLYLQFTEAFEAFQPGVAVLLGRRVRAPILRLGARPRGATHAKVESRGPSEELVISVVGPISSLGLGGLLLLLGLRRAGPPRPPAGRRAPLSGSPRGHGRGINDPRG
jgi:hypothetical protein